MGAGPPLVNFVNVVRGEFPPLVNVPRVVRGEFPTKLNHAHALFGGSKMGRQHPRQ